MAEGRKNPDRRLKEEDARLWEKVTETVSPLQERAPGNSRQAQPEHGAPTDKGKPPAIPGPGSRPGDSGPGDSGPGDSGPGDSAAQKAKAKGPPPEPVLGIERRLARRLDKGSRAIERVIDLHGLTRDQARARLFQEVAASRERGERRLLVITGKGLSSGRANEEGGETDLPPHETASRGILRRSLPDWLKEDEMARHVVAFEPARPRHGGGGAFYVILRRSRGKEPAG